MKCIRLSEVGGTSPLIPSLLKIAGFLKGKVGIVNARYGKRMISSAYPTKMEKLDENSFIEIVDYDVLNDILLYIGRQIPHKIVAQDWIIMSVREDVNFMVHVINERAKFSTPLEEAKEVLKSIGKEKFFYKDEKSEIALGKCFDDLIKGWTCL